MGIIDRIKSLFKKFLNKQLPQAETKVRDTDRINKRLQCKTKMLSEMSNNEINRIMSDMKLHPFVTQSYDDKQLLEEILKRIGAEEELVKRCVTNTRVNTIYCNHRLGKLISIKDGRTVYTDNSNGTTIEYKDGVIELNNPKYYDYYVGCMDARPTNQVKISTNDLGGITLENNEINTMDKEQLTSEIVFDINNIEMKKTKELFRIENGGMAISIIERNADNPFTIKETWKMDTTSIVNYASVDARCPDQLYSHYFIGKSQIKDIKIGINDINIKELRAINPKAARYFESLNSSEQICGEKQ